MKNSLIRSTTKKREIDISGPTTISSTKKEKENIRSSGKVNVFTSLCKMIKDLDKRCT